jgi:hypothetical protein
MLFFSSSVVGESNKEYTYKVKNIGLGSPGAAYLPSKGQKAPKIGKIGKMSLTMGCGYGIDK